MIEAREQETETSERMTVSDGPIFGADHFTECELEQLLCCLPVSNGDPWIGLLSDFRKTVIPMLEKRQLFAQKWSDGADEEHYKIRHILDTLERLPPEGPLVIGWVQSVVKERSAEQEQTLIITLSGKAPDEDTDLSWS